MADKNISQFTEETTRADDQIIYLGKPSGGTYVDRFMTMANAILGLQKSSEKGQPLGYAELDASGKVPLSQTSDSLLKYQGSWNAATNTPTLSDADTGVTNFWYRCNVAGTVDFGSGNITFRVGDKVVNNGTVWEIWDTNDSDITAADVAETSTLKWLTTLTQSITGIKTFVNEVVGHRGSLTKTASFSIRSTEKDRRLYLAITGAVTITVDDTSYSDIGQDGEIEIVWLSDSGSNSITFVAGGSQTIISKNGNLDLSAVGSAAILTVGGTNAWVLIGDLA